MARQKEQQHSDSVVAAIERVLKTERDGVEILRKSSEQVRQRQTQARAQAAALAKRADRCISTLHAAYLQKIEGKIQQLTAQAPSAAADKPYDAATLAKAADRVAAKLTSGA